MKKFIKSNLKVAISILITLIISINCTVFATSMFNAKEIEYKSNGNETVDDALNDLYAQDYNVEEINEYCYEKGCSLTKKYVATSDSIVDVDLICGGFTTESFSSISSKCSYESNGTLLYKKVLSHLAGGPVYNVILTYKLKAGDYISVNALSGSETYWYAGYNFVTVTK